MSRIILHIYVFKIYYILHYYHVELTVHGFICNYPVQWCQHMGTFTTQVQDSKQQVQESTIRVFILFQLYCLQDVFKHIIRFKILGTVAMTIALFWKLTQHTRVALHYVSVHETTPTHYSSVYHVLCERFTLSLKVEAINSTEIVHLYQITRLLIPEDRHLHHMEICGLRV